MWFPVQFDRSQVASNCQHARGDNEAYEENGDLKE